jgi:hypothetical protein
MSIMNDFFEHCEEDEAKQIMPDRPIPVEYEDLWYSLYEYVLGRDKHIKGIMEEMDPNLIEEEPGIKE